MEHKLTCPYCNAEYREAGTTEYLEANSGKLVAPPVRTITAEHADDCPLSNLRKK